MGDAMTNRRQSSASMRPAVIALFAAVAMLGSVTQVAGEEQHERFSAPARQNAPPQTYRSVAPVQIPSTTRQYNPSGLNGTMHVQQYNPPGLNSPGVNSTAGTWHQANPPGLTSQPQEMTMPGGIAGAGGPASSQAAPGPGGPGQGAGSGSYGSAYPVGYQAPAALQPPYPAQVNPPGLRQFTCRTAHYYCNVPYTGACQCENDRRERESGMTTD
jgi:hypothetical protein